MKTKIIFFQIILILSLYNLNAQWVQTNGPYEGRVNCLERVNNKIWAGTNIGIFESSNNGINWQKLQILPLYISSILNVNDTIVILYVQKNLQFPDEIDWLINTSFDNGSTWNNPVLVETTDNNVYPLELKYLQSTFFIKGNIGFYISNNYGMSWSSDPFLSGSYIESFMISGSNILMSTQNDTIPYSRYYLSQNNAQTWNYIYGTNNGGVCSYFKDSIILMFVTSYDTINHNYLVGSKNLGNTWDTTITLSPGCNSFGLTYSINDNIYTAMCNQNYLGFAELIKM